VIKVSREERTSLLRIPADEPPASPVIFGELCEIREAPCVECAGKGKVSYGPSSQPAESLMTCPVCGGSGKQRIPFWMSVRAIRRAPHHE